MARMILFGRVKNGILGLPVLILDIVFMPCCSGLEIPYYIIYNMHLESKSKICDRF